MQQPGVVTNQVNRVYQPTVTPVQVPQTTYVNRTMTRKVPVQSVRYVDEQVTTEVPVQTMRMVPEEQVRGLLVQFILRNHKGSSRELMGNLCTLTGGGGDSMARRHIAIVSHRPLLGA